MRLLRVPFLLVALAALALPATAGAGLGSSAPPVRNCGTLHPPTGARAAGETGIVGNITNISAVGTTCFLARQAAADYAIRVKPSGACGDLKTCASGSFPKCVSHRLVRMAGTPPIVSVGTKCTRGSHSVTFRSRQVVS